MASDMKYEHIHGPSISSSLSFVCLFVCLLEFTRVAHAVVVSPLLHLSAFSSPPPGTSLLTFTTPTTLRGATWEQHTAQRTFKTAATRATRLVDCDKSTCRCGRCVALNTARVREKCDRERARAHTHTRTYTHTHTHTCACFNTGTRVQRSHLHAHRGHVFAQELPT
jgi:hypothetical protein